MSLMRQTSFYVNTALVCFNCRRIAVIRLKESWRAVTRVGDEKEVLDIVFVVCAPCLKYPHIHDPGQALIPRYLESRLYLDQIQSLVYMFDCTPSIDEAPSFSLTSWKTKVFTRIYDTTDIFYISSIPDASIMILSNGCEVQRHCQFFRYERQSKVRRITRYPCSSAEAKPEHKIAMPFESVARRPPVLKLESPQPQLCESCVSQAVVDEPPPVYEANATEESCTLLVD
ncbi:hypothetical protein DL95DRAFT_469534 [Leptodontidium sp. 2 PMI_412]|nr:hypothetical protein DL95DRAFT_469534 [Leptodontidium sp. 2 PMI_412]